MGLNDRSRCAHPDFLQREPELLTGWGGGVGADIGEQTFFTFSGMADQTGAAVNPEKGSRLSQGSTAEQLSTDVQTGGVKGVCVGGSVV